MGTSNFMYIISSAKENINFGIFILIILLYNRSSSEMFKKFMCKNL